MIIELIIKKIDFSCFILLALFIFSLATSLFAAEEEEEFMLE